MIFALDILIILGVFALLAIGLDLIVGFTGILSIGHAAFYAVGAYVAALAAKELGVSFPMATLLAMLAAGGFGLLVALPVFRIRGDFLIVVTLGLGEIVHSILLNWTEVTGGARGVRGVPPLRIFGWEASNDWGFFVAEWFLVSLVIVLILTLKRSHWGQQLKGIRDDEVSMQALGYPVFRLKISVFFAAGVLGGLAGSLFAHYRTYINPSTFGLETSVLVFCMCIIGGLGSVWGALAGAAVFWCLPELLRLIGPATFDAASFRQLVLGITVIMIMVYRPRGIWGERRVKN